MWSGNGVACGVGGGSVTVRAMMGRWVTESSRARRPQKQPSVSGVAHNSLHGVHGLGEEALSTVGTRGSVRARVVVCLC